MALTLGVALFDLDQTLLAGDSEHLWGTFLAHRTGADAAIHEQESQRFYDEYLAGTLDFDAYMRFRLEPMAAIEAKELLFWRDRYIGEIIEPIIAPQARALLERHRAKGHALLIVTAANRFVCQPIAEILGVQGLLATEPEYSDGRLTGRFVGTPCFREGKITHLTAWLCQQTETLDESWCYSDSHNDLPLLEQAQHPVAVDPDPILERAAKRRGWSIISLRGSELGSLPGMS